MPDTNSNAGRKRRVTDADLLDVFRGTADPVLSTAEVAEAVPIKRRGVLSRLRSLEADGDLDSKQIGGRNTVWWLVDESDESRRESDPTPAPTEPPGDAPDAESDAREQIDGLDLAGSGTDYERRRDAVLEMYAHLRGRPGERVSKSDFETLLAGTDVGYGGGFSSLWSNWVKSSDDRPNVLDILPGVTLQGNDYVFRPEDGQ